MVNNNFLRGATDAGPESSSPSRSFCWLPRLPDCDVQLSESAGLSLPNCESRVAMKAAESGTHRLCDWRGGNGGWAYIVTIAALVDMRAATPRAMRLRCAGSWNSKIGDSRPSSYVTVVEAARKRGGIMKTCLEDDHFSPC